MARSFGRTVGSLGSGSSRARHSSVTSARVIGAVAAVNRPSGSGEKIRDSTTSSAVTSSAGSPMILDLEPGTARGSSSSARAARSRMALSAYGVPSATAKTSRESRAVRWSTAAVGVTSAVEIVSSTVCCEPKISRTPANPLVRVTRTRVLLAGSTSRLISSTVSRSWSSARTTSSTRARDEWGGS